MLKRTHGSVNGYRDTLYLFIFLVGWGGVGSTTPAPSVGCTFIALLFLASLASFHEALLGSLLPLLSDPKPLSVRKRAYFALCELIICTARACASKGTYMYLEHVHVKVPTCI